jgi:hypothetical protein
VVCSPLTRPLILRRAEEEAVRVSLRALFALIAVAWFVMANAVNYRWPDVFLYLALFPAGPRARDMAWALLNPTGQEVHGWVREELPWIVGFAANALVWAAAITVAVWLVRRMRRRAPEEAPAGA